LCRLRRSGADRRARRYATPRTALGVASAGAHPIGHNDRFVDERHTRQVEALREQRLSLTNKRNPGSEYTPFDKLSTTRVEPDDFRLPM
jgi:hypothetical protein